MLKGKSQSDESYFYQQTSLMATEELHHLYQILIEQWARSLNASRQFGENTTNAALSS